MVIIMNLKGLKESSKINIEKIEEFVPGNLYLRNPKNRRQQYYYQK